jgi:hypothetical protein
VANRHFANFGDVWKHLPLAEVLRLRPAAQYWETHAGSPTYPLTSSATRNHGAIRFRSLAPTDPGLIGSSYLEALLADPSTYPGSPALAMRALGTKARYLFCDLDPDTAQSLRAAGRSLSMKVEEADGISTILHEADVSVANPSDVLVHIDPYDPFERMTPDSLTPIELAGRLAERGYRVFFWYGYESMTERGWARETISRMSPNTSLWCGDMIIPSPFVFPDRGGVWGCGVVLAKMTKTEAEICHRLGTALERISTGDVFVGNDPSRPGFAVM